MSPTFDTANLHVSRFDGKDRRRLISLKCRVTRVRDFPENTCQASRNLHIMADQLSSKSGIYYMLLEEPDHCAESIYAVLESLWKARNELKELRAKLKKAKSDD